MTTDAAIRARVARRNARRGLRLTTRGRIVLVVLLALLAALVAVGIDAAATDGAATGTYATVIVQPGDTLWGMAHELSPGDDPREIVQRLLDLNGLTSPIIVPGQELAVPTF